MNSQIAETADHLKAQRRTRPPNPVWRPPDFVDRDPPPRRCGRLLARAGRASFLLGRRGARTAVAARAEAAGRLGRRGLAPPDFDPGRLGRCGLCGGPDLRVRRVIAAFIQQKLL